MRDPHHGRFKGDTDLHNIVPILQAQEGDLVGGAASCPCRDLVPLPLPPCCTAASSHRTATSTSAALRPLAHRNPVHCSAASRATAALRPEPLRRCHCDTVASATAPHPHPLRITSHVGAQIKCTRTSPCTNCVKFVFDCLYPHTRKRYCLYTVFCQHEANSAGPCAQLSGSHNYTAHITELSHYQP